MTSFKSCSTCFLFIIEVMLLPVQGLAPGNPQEVCEWEDFKAKCPDNHVIVITQAAYGRMRLGRCVQENLGYLGCQTNVKSVLDMKCSGRTECTVRVPDAKLEENKACSELKNYLEASYECRKVESLGAKCQKCDYVRVKNKVGYLASAVTSETGCGSTECPWLISGGSGQYIKLSLLDFSMASQNRGQGEVCKVYAVIKEVKDKNIQKSQTICGGRSRNREQEVYISTGSELEVRILGGSKDDDQAGAYFLLKYEVFGCPILTVEGATIHKDTTKAQIICEEVERSWTVTCNGSHWVGKLGNCSENGNPGGSDLFSADPVFNSTSLIIMTAVAIIICALVVVIGIVCFKICTNNNPRRRSAQSYEDPPDLCHPPPLTHDSYCITHMPHVASDGTMTIDRCVVPKVMCKTYNFENGQKNDYEHICDSSTIPRPDLGFST